MGDVQRSGQNAYRALLIKFTVLLGLVSWSPKTITVVT